MINLMENCMNLEAIQRELEDAMVSKGAERYAKALDRGVSNVGPGKALMRKALYPMAAAFEEVVSAPNKSRIKKGFRPILDLDPHIVADLTARRVLDCAVKEETLIKTCKAIAKAIEWHTKDASLHAATVAIWNKTQERLKKTNNPEFRRASIDGTVEGMKRWAAENAPDLANQLEDVRGLDWGIEQQLEVGGALVSLFKESTKLINTEEVRKGRDKSAAIVRLSEGTAEWLDRNNARESLLRPVHVPMVVPPKNWSDMDSGGYLDNDKAGVHFIKTHAKVENELENHDLSDVYDAVNLIQKTAWRVNAPLFAVMKQAWENGSGIGGLPPKFEEDGKRDRQPLPSRLADMTPEQRKADPEYKAWVVVARDVHEYNADLKADVANFRSLMTVATQFSEFPAFYHPHKLDWRQRAYPISMFLSPQGDQFNKGLIEFAEGKRMGDSDNAAAWLAIHGANCYGVDKVSFEERIEWVETFTASILESALDPFGTEFWQAADKPWPFLAFCMEWAGYLIAGDDFVTHLPVALDGSNSGLQHLSAMILDPEGARITCVAPGEQPEDVYQMVADAVEAQLCLEDDQMAAIWRGRVTRKVVKQPTMTYTYSATISGMRDQIKSALTSLDADAETVNYLPFTDPLQTNAKAADFLAPIVRQAIKTRMTKAAAAMEFLQGLAKVYSKTDRPLRWVTPLGLPVVQYYPTSTSKRKRLFIDGTLHQLRINVDLADEEARSGKHTDRSKQDTKRASSGVSPNFVHSMDSTHLLWTVLYCNDVHQLDAFAMIHDSFGTHATACDELASATRETFVALYDEDRLTTLREQFVESLRVLAPELIQELPEVPTFGTFDIESVRKSDYFFA